MRRYSKSAELQLAAEIALASAVIIMAGRGKKSDVADLLPYSFVSNATDRQVSRLRGGFENLKGKPSEAIFFTSRQKGKNKLILGTNNIEIQMHHKLFCTSIVLKVKDFFENNGIYAQHNSVDKPANWTWT